MGDTPTHTSTDYDYLIKFLALGELIPSTPDIEDLTWVFMFYCKWVEEKRKKCEACGAFYLFFSTNLIQDTYVSNLSQDIKIT